MNKNIHKAYHRYAAKTTALIQEFSTIEEALLNRKPAADGWSAIQTLLHLVFVEENSLAYVQKKLSFNPVFEKAGLKAWFRSKLLWLSMYTPIKFKAPKAAGNERLPEHATFAELQAQWGKSQLAWQEFFEKMPDDLVDKLVYKHPRAGRLSLIQMLDFLSVHLERHRRQALKAVS